MVLEIFFCDFFLIFYEHNKLPLTINYYSQRQHETSHTKGHLDKRPSRITGKIPNNSGQQKSVNVFVIQPLLKDSSDQQTAVSCPRTSFQKQTFQPRIYRCTVTLEYPGQSGPYFSTERTHRCKTVSLRSSALTFSIQRKPLASSVKLQHSA